MSQGRSPFRWGFGVGCGLICAVLFAMFVVPFVFAYLAKLIFGIGRHEPAPVVEPAQTRVVEPVEPPDDEIPMEKQIDGAGEKKSAEPTPPPDPAATAAQRAAAKLAQAKELRGRESEQDYRKHLEEIVEQFRGTAAADEARQLLGGSGKK